MKDEELWEAFQSGDLAKLRQLLDEGADIRYERPNGYTPLIDFMCAYEGRNSNDFLAILQLLIDRGAELDAETYYGESALSVASRVGRFDAVDILLRSGADPAPLKWTELHRVVATGTLDQLKQCLLSGPELGARDGWNRTPTLLAVQTGDVVKVELLLSLGGSLDDRGRCGKTVLLYPIEQKDLTMLRWLLERGINPDETDDFGGTSLIAAAEAGDARFVRALLDAGADPTLRNDHESPIGQAANLEIARMLAEAGADFTEINKNVRDQLTGREKCESIDCSREEFDSAKHRTFGNSNPEKMNHPFWKAMVTCGLSAYHARELFDQSIQDGKPVWSFDRFGKSFTELPDGRVIEIAGEHEDHYDPDFCIYNDVIVHHGDGTFDIYGYPPEVFPPTDFHTATLVGNFIYIIGSLGYAGTRRYGSTQVYRLEINSLAMELVETSGESPGWICKHKAKLIEGAIAVEGGKILERGEGQEEMVENECRFVLDLESMRWGRVL